MCVCAGKMPRQNSAPPILSAGAWELHRSIAHCNAHAKDLLKRPQGRATASKPRPRSSIPLLHFSPPLRIDPESPAGRLRTPRRQQQKYHPEQQSMGLGMDDHSDPRMSWHSRILLS